jgi:cytochrome c553
VNKLTRKIIRLIQTISIIALGLGAYFGIQAFLGERTAHALPEFATRTGEPCAACHVSPGGGGPRTLRGLLWAARGRPDAVPQFPGLLVAPGVAEGSELYDIACAGCHGFSGEGLFGINLAGIGISKAAARTFISQGIPELDMPAFEGQFTEDQLDTLAAFVQQLGDGQVPPQEFQLPSPQLSCQPLEPGACGGD